MASIRHLIRRYYPKIVEEIVDKYRATHGAEPINVSHWDPSPEFTALMNRTLEVPATESPIPYLYAPDSQQVEAAIKTIGTLSSAVMTTPSGTASIACVLFWLASTSVRRLLILTPTYFSAALLAEVLGFDVEFAAMRRTANGYELPQLPKGIDAIWITNPLYCTTHYFTPLQLRRFRDLLEDDVYVIADEPMSFPRQNAGSSLAAHRKFIGIYSPHKAIGINGLKCSLIASDESVRGEMLDIFDGLVGGLPLSAMTAIAHLVSANFGECTAAYDAYIHRSYDRVRDVTSMFSAVSLDSFARTNFVSAFVPHLSASLGRDADFLYGAAEATSAIAFPSVIHLFGDDCGLGFRINLTAVDDRFIAGLRRWCHFLDCRSPVRS